MKFSLRQLMVRIGYLITLNELMVPHAFGFIGRKLLFVGHGPFHPQELGSLLPNGIEWHEHDDAPEEFSPCVLVLGRDGFEKGAIKSALKTTEREPKVVPQEGFVDELLFGHDWWDGKVGSLEIMVNQHPGLQSARSIGALSPVAITQPQPKKKQEIVDPHASRFKLPKSRKSRRAVPTSPSTDFSWPSTEAEESRNAGRSDLDWQAETRLYQLGYRITGLSRSQRWRVLITTAIPELGLGTVANTIARHCRNRKHQKGGREKYSHAIAEWEHDLARLKREIYRPDRHRFPWPKSEL